VATVVGDAHLHGLRRRLGMTITMERARVEVFSFTPLGSVWCISYSFSDNKFHKFAHVGQAFQPA